ncbi:MAG: hypothetical protein JXA96_09965 [Sedimentisphaerales bacterium]|nr:hypothetical protein [Sedimentisphaerales bacterium]
MLVLLLAYAAVVMVILYTDLPRDLVLKTLNEKYGLHVTIDSMQITSGGQTTIDKLSMSLPMEDAPILAVPKIIIKHTKIPFVLFRGFKLKNVKIENPIVNIRQNQTGTWNLQRLAYNFQQPSQGGKRKSLSIPDLEISYGTAIVTKRNGDTETISPIVLEGKTTKPHVWDFQGDIAPQITLHGRLAQTGDLYHEVNIDVNSLPKSLQNLIGSISEPLKMNANWKGSVREKGLSGVLKIEKEGSFLANGTMDMQMSPEGFSVNIGELLLSGLNKSLGTIKVLGGKLHFDGKQLKAQRIFVDADQNQASISGNWNIEERRGDFDCSLTGARKEKDIDYENTLSGSVSWPKNGKKQIDLSVTSHGNSPWGNWQSNAEFLSLGENLSNSKWNVTVPSLVWNSEKYNIQVQDIKTEIIADWPVIKFDDINMANAQRLNAQGEFSADTKNWNISLEAEKLKVVNDQNFLIDLILAAQGDINNITVKEFSMTCEDLRLEGHGNVSLLSKELSNTNFKVSMEMTPKAQSEKMLENISGNLECETEISGTVWPINIQCESVFTTDNIIVNKQIIKSLKIPWQAKIDSNNVTYEAEQFDIFDGKWSLDGRYDLKQRSAQVTLNTEQVSLRPVMQLFSLPIECKGIMKAALDVTLPIDNINQMVISGNWNVKDLVIPPIEAKDAEGRIIIENGTAQFDKIRLLQGKGIAQADAWFRLNQPGFVYVNVESQKWPIAISLNNMVLTTNAKGFATLDLSKRTMKGKGNISTDFEVGEKKLANLSANIVVEERLLDFNDMTIEAMSGQAVGDVSIQMDNLTNSKVTLDWNEIDLGELAVYYPELESLEGKSSGSLIVKQAESERAFEPLQIDINGNIADGSLREAKLGDYKISAYLGKKRLLIDRAEIESLNGQIKSYGSITKQAESYSMYMNTDFSQIETNQLLHAFLPNAKPVIGRLTGKGMLVIFSDLKRMTGDANIQITESDLAQTKIIGTLYNTMKLKFGKNKPSGYGQVKLRFEGSSLHIPSFEYFNRGIEVRGSGSILDLANGKKSQVKGYAFGSARPLKGINLLGIDELDKLMTSLQKRVASVQVNGSLENYDVEVVPFKDISKGLRVLLWDQLHK